jgi:hypothetical protein
MKHISEILPKVLSQVSQAQEVNDATSRHIAKLFSWLEEKNEPLNLFQQGAVKKQFRFLQDDIINLISEVPNDDKFNR